MITRGIRVSVVNSFQENYSKPLEFRFVFSYHITIENLSDDTVQLLRRHWYILDSNGITREVEGEGVVGEQPVLRPGQAHQYVSWCHLMTDLGRMHGAYLMVNIHTGEEFLVDIPEFKLVAPQKLN